MHLFDPLIVQGHANDGDRLGRRHRHIKACAPRLAGRRTQIFDLASHRVGDLAVQQINELLFLNLLAVQPQEDCALTCPNCVRFVVDVVIVSARCFGAIISERRVVVPGRISAR